MLIYGLTALVFINIFRVSTLFRFPLNTLDLHDKQLLSYGSFYTVEPGLSERMTLYVQKNIQSGVSVAVFL